MNVLKRRYTVSVRCWLPKRRKNPNLYLVKGLVAESLVKDLVAESEFVACRAAKVVVTMKYPEARSFYAKIIHAETLETS